MQLSFIGVLGMLLEAKETEMIHAVKPLLENLKEIGFHLAPQVFDLVPEQAGELI